MNVVDRTATAEVTRDAADALAVTALTLARRIANGASLWCVAPTAPAHAAHLAVEFLHPVIMGKRAVPAVAVEAPDPCAVVRTARPGDVLLLLGPSADPELGRLARRAAPWGLTSVWIATDDGPGATADHVLRIRHDDPDVELVLSYHLLWELTHVVFEHPGLLVGDEDDDGERCLTCSDDALVAEVESVDRDRAHIRIDGGRAEAAIDLVEGVSPGDLLLVHAGVAIDRIEEVP